MIPLLTSDRRPQSISKKKQETVRQKNNRKEKLGQAKFTLKANRDCPDIWRSTQYDWGPLAAFRSRTTTNFVCFWQPSGSEMRRYEEKKGKPSQSTRRRNCWVERTRESERTTPAHAARFGQVDSLERTAPSHRTPAFPRQCPTPDRDSRPPRAASPRRLVRRAAYYVRTITNSFCSRYDRQFPVPRSPARGRAIYPRDRIPSSSHPPRRRGWKRRRWGWRARAAAHIGADRTPRWTRSGAERGRPAPCRGCPCAASAPHGIQSVSVR